MAKYEMQITNCTLTELDYKLLWKTSVKAARIRINAHFHENFENETKCIIIVQLPKGIILHIINGTCNPRLFLKSG
jgi:hypothetical protein